MGDDAITVASNPTFAVQAYRLWDGLVASMEAPWKDDIEQGKQEPASQPT